jgi:hypothetical protein
MTPPELSTLDANRPLHGDEVFIWIKIVASGLIDHTNLVEFRRILIGDDLLQLPPKAN